MRTLKLVALSVLLIASLGLAACTGTDMSGTAGDEPAPVAPGEGVEPAPGDENAPPEKEDPGAVNEPIGGSNDAGGDTGGSNDAGSGAKVDQTTDVFLASLAPTQRVDIDYIKERCNGCEDADALLEYVQAACAEGAPGCTVEFETLLNKKRTATQIRNDQGLVGLPSADELLEIYKDFQDGVAPVDAAPGDNSAEAGDEGDDSGEVGAEPPAGGDDSGEEPVKGDDGAVAPAPGDEGGDESAAPAVLPDAPAESAKALAMAMNEVASDSVAWADVAAVADKADVQAVAEFFEAAVGADAQIPSCDNCLALIKELLAGGEVDKAELMNLLTALTTIG